MNRWLGLSKVIAPYGDLIGASVSLAVMTLLIASALVSITKRAGPSFPIVPLTPSQHAQYLSFVFGPEAWRTGGGFQRALLVIIRLALVVAMVGIVIWFATNVTVAISGAPPYPPPA